MFFVAHFSILFSFKAKKFFKHFFQGFEFVSIHRALTISIMPAVVTEKSRHIIIIIIIIKCNTPHAASNYSVMEYH